MHEDIRTILPGNEPVPLGIVEPLHLAGCHLLPSYKRELLLQSPAPPKIAAEVTGGKKTVKCVLTAPSNFMGNHDLANDLVGFCSRDDRPNAGHARRAGGQTFRNLLWPDAAQRQDR